MNRKLKFWWQRRIRGFDDSETWSLSHTILRFTLPRLKRFREVNKSYPPDLTPEKWDENIDYMIKSIEIWIDYDGRIPKERQKEFRKGWNLFTKYFFDLWS